jgi:hypothetical protein
VQFSQVGNTTATLSFRTVRDASLWGLVYQLERSFDLVDWEPIPPNKTATLTSDGPWYERFEKQVSLTSEDRQKFVRVRVTLPH